MLKNMAFVFFGVECVISPMPSKAGAQVYIY